MKDLDTEMEAREVEPLADEALEGVAGGKTPPGAAPGCGSCRSCRRLCAGPEDEA